MSEPESYDLVVLGAGPAGEKGAATAALLGRSVVVVERARDVGGAATNTGTLPSKTLRETALALSGFKARSLYGVDLSLRREATVTDLMYHEKRVTQSERGRILGNLARPGVRLVHGEASFVDAHTVRVQPVRMTGRYGPSRDPATSGKDGEPVLLRGAAILIATGSAPVRPATFPFEHPQVCDSDQILALRRLPRRLAVVGAGVIGSEYACVFAALGCEVHVIDARDLLLPFLDHEMTQTLQAAMERLGIVFHWNEKVERCDAPERGDIALALASGERLAVDTVLVAAGRQSNVESLRLEAAGIEAGPRGAIPVDGHFRTVVPHIYAAGDVIGHPALASTSAEQARVAMSHAFDPSCRSEVSPILPTGIYTIPEIGCAGATERALQEQKVDYVVGRALYAQNARGEIIGDGSGVLKLLFRREDGRLLGVHVIGEGATEVVHIGLLGLLTGSDWNVLSRACFNYPTLGDLYKTAAENALQDVWQSGGRGR